MNIIHNGDKILNNKRLCITCGHKTLGVKASAPQSVLVSVDTDKACNPLFAITKIVRLLSQHKPPWLRKRISPPDLYFYSPRYSQPRYARQPRPV